MAGDRTRLAGLAIATILIASGFGLALAPTAAATDVSPSCGDTLSAGEYVLTADVGPCSGPAPALTVDGADLDMDGHKVIGADAATVDCIDVIGLGSIVEKGTVTGCTRGIVVRGTGSHIVQELTSVDNRGEGFEVDSDGNLIRATTSKRSAEHGYQIDGDNNLLTSDTSDHAGEFGFLVRGDSNALWSSTASASTQTGFVLEGPGAGNVLAKTRATKGGEGGYEVASDANQLFRNTASSNATTGFFVLGSNNTIGSNKATSNEIDGVRVHIGTGNLFAGNAASDSGSDDLDDVDGACTTNVWEKNVGKVVSDPCTRGVVLTSPVDLAPTCGSTVPPGDYRLTTDFSCGITPGLTLNGARLDLDGHTISGTGGGDCVLLDGGGALLENGTVLDCGRAVVADGTGGHIVRDVTTVNSAGSGLALSSGSNIVHDNVSKANDDSAIFVTGGGNFIFSNVSVGPDHLVGDGNQEWNNKSSKGSEGFVVDVASDGNTLVGNSASKTQLQGIEVRGDDNVVIANKVSGAHDHGFDFTSTPGAANNIVGGNKSVSNKKIGIVAAASGNRIVGNTAKKNKLFDLADGNGDCDSNLWDGNKFKTRDPSCIS